MTVVAKEMQQAFYQCQMIFEYKTLSNFSQEASKVTNREFMFSNKASHCFGGLLSLEMHIPRKKIAVF